MDRFLGFVCCDLRIDLSRLHSNSTQRVLLTCCDLRIDLSRLHL
ncbi:Isoquinoline 1-oxidoreductase beta subunit [uncultured Candidatus Thioglobus sp.]|nr:Isoquinoline 1-oxidoreductase beta subunit [uncultured Candidatus Thioglobus sp.]